MTNQLKDDQPIFLQIAEVIETSIVEGQRNAHDQVPSTNEFAKFYRINPATAAKGINLLVDQGILFKKRGVGMFVTDQAKQIILEKRKNSFYDHYMKPLISEARRIHLSKAQLYNWIEEGFIDEN
ncbi:GntR family transcriptional regulator [Amphibacillus jilinensis]|uniref:GntR family transcriptional regulator n=1 Tax=Amphibacillus jilinensis TaxID=1216008 RepID=UPI0002E37A06|nr:GntR family transcriptional regulator [Amphibacillus jilinensis]